MYLVTVLVLYSDRVSRLKSRCIPSLRFLRKREPVVVGPGGELSHHFNAGYFFLIITSGPYIRITVGISVLYHFNQPLDTEFARIGSPTDYPRE